MGSSSIIVNGTPRACAASPHVSLLDWLREQGWTGAKEGCAEGECGACAVLVARPDVPGQTRWTSVNACLPPALALDGQEVVTSEGLGAGPTPGQGAELHPVQREMADRGGSQCGYCTPGFVCAMAAEFYRPERAPQAGPDSPECGANGFDLHALSGNLCRCTGYRPIRDAAYALGDPDPADPLTARREHAAPMAAATAVRERDGQFVRPTELATLLSLLADSPDAVLLAGATDAGVERNLRHTRSPLVLAIDRLEELRTLVVDEGMVEIGAALTLSEIERGLAGRVPLLADLFPQFASRLIRNAATLGGNLGTGSPIGDAAPVLLALDADLVLASAAGEREVPLAEYSTGYRQSVRRAGELIRAVRVPLPLAPRTAFYKIAKRRFDDISSVAVAIAMTLEGGVVESVRIGLGGVAATPVRALATEQALVGQAWDLTTATRAAEVMGNEGTPLDDHRASARYRSAMLKQALLRFFDEQGPTKPLQKDGFGLRNHSENGGDR
ncbi:2Fe-2S iron-sulfur cluster binding domain-containing protein [Ornithinimicrobium ciconiae]|uniref:2Fe-2S iron-sulfur cluster binding domain-containing protein n=1 Tax=Ornithinimicrobium ciconiae TaxID=2594265 RepID=A0A516GFD2_9MICO|nr:FAD binding domain-containing protein [Ornithinimicrobium ciconiae]QDO90225.1 2Fe-2S iron-sulfur cluster binding domain-containing protein [Ornithinimicrobium ciconiae]